MNSMTDDHFDYSAEASHNCPLSWSAILAGAVVAMAVSLILLLLGSGLELSSISPWSHTDYSVTSFTVKTAIWLIVMQWVASGVGGYITGRMRSKWVDIHNDEVLFRDTAHGLLTWATATVVTAALLSSAATAALSGGAKAGATVAAGAAAGAAHGGPADKNGNDTYGYYIDSLFRTAPEANSNTHGNAAANAAPAGIAPPLRDETLRIFVTDEKNGSITPEDKAYLSSLVASRAGISQDEASARVGNVIAQYETAKQKAKEDAEAARQAGLKASFYLFFSMLVGAFIACVASAMGGTHRDTYSVRTVRNDL